MLTSGKYCQNNKLESWKNRFLTKTANGAMPPPPPKLNLNLSNIDGEIPNRVNVPIKKCRNSF